jgi:phosphoserine phosphatase
MIPNVQQFSRWCVAGSHFSGYGRRVVGAVAKLVIVRHGRTEWNADGRRQGREDIPLDLVWHQQAASLGDQLRDHRFTSAFCSPLVRARETARVIILERHHVEITVDTRLIEFDFGSLSGTRRSEVPLSLRHQHLDEPVPGGESLRDAWNRCTEFTRHLRESVDSEATVLVVGHERLNGLLCGVLSGWTLEHTARAKAHRFGPGGFLEMPLHTAPAVSL